MAGHDGMEGVSLPRTPPTGRYLAFDFGLRRIGVATGQTLTATTSPLCILQSRNGVPDWPAIQALIDEWRPVGLVVGLPQRAHNNEEQLSTRQARKFGQRLSGRSGLPVYFQPEQYTSVSAEQMLQVAGLPADHVDAVAAELILAQFFHELQSRPV